MKVEWLLESKVKINDTIHDARPIMFTDEMSRAAEEGRKTQTRRIIKVDSKLDLREIHDTDISFIDRVKGEVIFQNRKYKPGMVLYEKENYYRLYQVQEGIESPCERYSLIYAYPLIDNDLVFVWKRKSKRFMPRILARKFYLIKTVRVERLQEITPQDCWDEGSKCNCIAPVSSCKGNIDSFIELWDSINTKRGYSWESNPWVLVIEFEKLCKK